MMINTAEEKIVKHIACIMTGLVCIICVSLFYLPILQMRAESYFAKKQLMKQQWEERQMMFAQMSGLEFLNYMTTQAMQTAVELPEEEMQEAVEALDFPQQMRLEMPKGVSQDDVTIEDDYLKRTIRFTIPSAGDDYLIQYPMIGKSDHIEDLRFDTDENGAVIELSMEKVYELDATWQDQYLYIDFVAPQDKYDKVVVIDAGHGAKMPGAVVGTVMEKDIDLAIVQEVKKIFDAAADPTIGVYYTRLDDSDPEFADRAGLANYTEANLFVSVHNNSIAGASNANGTQVLYDEKRELEGLSSKHLADILLKKVTGALGTKNMGLVAGNNIYVVRSSEPPSALVEVGFMTNKKELANLVDPDYQKKCAQAIYDGILQALEEGY